MQAEKKEGKEGNKMCVQYYPERFGENYIRERDKKGITNEVVSSLLDIDIKEIKDWENGVIFPSIEVVSRVCGILECNLQELLR